MAFANVSAAAVTPVQAQEARPRASARMPVVGFLHPGVPDPASPSMATLRQGLRELGHVEGQAIGIEYRPAELDGALTTALKE